MIFVLVPLVRSYLSGTISLPFVASLSFQIGIFVLYVSMLCSKVDAEIVFENFSKSIHVLVIIFFATYLMGFYVPQEYEDQAVILNMLGISVNRVHFLFSPGINSTGYLAGYVVLNSTFRIGKNISSFNLLSLFAGLAVLLLTDSRGAIFSVFLVILLFKTGLIQSFFKTIYFHPVIIGLVLGLVFYMLINASGGIESLARGKYPLGGREFIWYFGATNIVSDIKHLLIGYGYLGQSISEVYKNYEFVFGLNRDAETMSLHNYILQTIYDVGILGLAVLYYMIKGQCFQGRPYVELFLAYILLLGILEVSLNIYSFYFFSLLIVTISSGEKTS